MEWLRWYVGCSTDPKFRVVARRCNVPVASVIAVWAMLLERACCSAPRGQVDGFDCESADAALDLEEGTACGIVRSLEDKGLINDGEISKWQERQTVKNDETATDRKRRQREKERQEKDAASRDVTPCHAASRDVTTDKIREEEKNINTYSASAPPAAPPDAVSADNSESRKPEEKPGEPPDKAEEFYRTKKGRRLTGKRLATFNRFMDAFGLRKGKAEAADAWLDIPQLTDALVVKIIKAAEREAAARPQFVAAGRTPKWAQGWISGRRWEDDVPENIEPPPKTDEQRAKEQAEFEEWSRELRNRNMQFAEGLREKKAKAVQQ